MNRQGSKFQQPLDGITVVSRSVRCAVYARKSNEQSGEGEDRSVLRQIANARAFIEAKGWAVAEDHVYSDDGVSGVKSKKLVSKVKMLDVIASGDAPFQVLVMQANDRLSRRDGDEAFGELKTIARAGVEVWFYSTGTPFKFGTFETNITGFINGEMAAQYRRLVSQKTRESHETRARQGYVTGGLTFGYDNLLVGSHVEHRVNEAEAAVVRQIYEAFAGGAGLRTIAYRLNAQGAPAPMPRPKGRPRGWCAGSVRAVLQRQRYRGIIIWGQRGRRPGDDPESPPKRMPESEWIRAEVPSLRIIDEKLARKVDDRFASVQSRTLRRANGTLIGRPPGEGAKYLLTGLLACHECGASMEVLSGTSGSGKKRRRVYDYRCSARRRRGPTACTNTAPADMAALDKAVLDVVGSTVLNPDVIERSLAYAEAAILRASTTDDTKAIENELADVEKATARLTRAIASSDGELGPLVDALKAQESRRVALQARLTALAVRPPTATAADVRKKLRGYLADWQGLLGGHTEQAQQVLRRLVVGRLTVRPLKDGHAAFEGAGTVRPLLAGAIHLGASPSGFEPEFQP